MKQCRSESFYVVTWLFKNLILFIKFSLHSIQELKKIKTLLNGVFYYEGEILAKQLAALGAKLIISARNEVELERVKMELTGILFYSSVSTHCFPINSRKENTLSFIYFVIVFL